MQKSTLSFRCVSICLFSFTFLLVSAGLAFSTARNQESQDSPPSVETDPESAGEESEDSELDAGMEFLDQATETKITAASLEDLRRVIVLCDRAQRAGLSGENLDYCEKLRASSQMQKGLVIARVLVDSGNPLPTKWTEIRHEALSDLEAAIAVITDNPQAFFYIARLNFLPEGDRKRGTEALDITIEKAGEEDAELKTRAILMKAVVEEDEEKKYEFLKTALETSPDSLSVLLACGAFFYDSGRLDEAARCMEKAIELEPDNTTALGVIAQIYSQQRKFEEALKVLDQLEKLLPEEIRLKVERARIYAQTERYDEAIELLEEARAKSPNNPMVLMIRASIYITKKDYEKAEKDLAALSRIAFDPDIEDTVRRLRIEMRVHQERYNEALREIDKLLSQVGDYDIELKIWKALILSAKKSNSQAIALLKELLERPQEDFRGKDYFNAQRVLGDASLGIGNHHQAIRAYQKAMEIDPEDAPLLNNYSWVLATSPISAHRNGKLALELALKAAEKTEYKKAHVLSTLGAAYAENNDFENALKWAEKAVELGETEEHDRIEYLKKEVESYKERKPWRELNEDDLDEDYRDKDLSEGEKAEQETEKAPENAEETDSEAPGAEPQIGPVP